MLLGFFAGIILSLTSTHARNLTHTGRGPWQRTFRPAGRDLGSALFGPRAEDLGSALFGPRAPVHISFLSLTSTHARNLTPACVRVGWGRGWENEKGGGGWRQRRAGPCCRVGALCEASPVSCTSTRTIFQLCACAVL